MSGGLKKIRVLAERMYPYVFACIIVLAIYQSGVDIREDENLNDLITGIITLESIVIGLMGAIIPVILSMKNESKFVKYVFEKDTNGLFRKYITVTIGEGILSVAVTLVMFVRLSIPEKVLNVWYNAWIVSVILFLFLTYRSMKYMVLLIFAPDKDNVDDDNSSIKIDMNKINDIRNKRKSKS